jgi:hypothetical protein
MARIKALKQPANQEEISVINDSKNEISYKYLLHNFLFLAESYIHRYVYFYVDKFINIIYSYVS